MKNRLTVERALEVSNQFGITIEQGSYFESKGENPHMCAVGTYVLAQTNDVEHAQDIVNLNVEQFGTVPSRQIAEAMGESPDYMKGLCDGFEGWFKKFGDADNLDYSTGYDDGRAIEMAVSKREQGEQYE